jgi:phosphoribosyl 1,2-cyclic phosphate phosphodiesterase
MIESKGKRIIIDTSIDFREQCLRYGIGHVDAVIYTHHHFDHIGGFDDLRGLNFVMRKPVKVAASRETQSTLKQIFSYAFNEGGVNETSAPVVEFMDTGENRWDICGVEVETIPLWHGKLKVQGFRFGEFAYCTDCSHIPPEGMKRLKGVKYLIIDGLRQNPHPTHMTMAEGSKVGKTLGVEKTWLIHMSHDVLHKRDEEQLEGECFLAYDGLCLEID